MAKLSKQDRLLKKYSKGGFAKAEKKLIANKLDIKLSDARKLTNAYAKQLKIGSTNASADKNKSTTTNPFGIGSTSYAPGVSAPGTNQPKTPKKTQTAIGLPKQDPISGPLSPERIKQLTGQAPKYTGPSSTGGGTTGGGTTGGGTTGGGTTGGGTLDLKSIIEDILGDQSNSTEFTVDPNIGNLQNAVQTANTNLQNLQNTFNESNQTYLTQIEGLRGELSGYEKQIGDYRGQIDDMSNRLLEQAQNARQFKRMDTEYLSNNTASGIRLRRSKKFRSGDFALGTSGLNRKNRSPLQISNVNL